MKKLHPITFTLVIFLLLSSCARPSKDVACAELAKSRSNANPFQISWANEEEGGRWVLSVGKSEISPAYLLINSTNVDMEGVNEGEFIVTNEHEAEFKSGLFSITPPLNFSSNSSYAMLNEDIAPWSSTERIIVTYPVSAGGYIMQADGRYSKKYLSGPSHSKENGLLHAVDIAAEMGVGVVAAQSGLVVFTRDGFPDAGCGDARLGQSDNRVIILQDDGLEATYGHLMLNSITVSPGDRIEEGDTIAKVGNSGATSDPHLHFQLGGINKNGFMTFPVGFTCGDAIFHPAVDTTICNE